MRSDSVRGIPRTEQDQSLAQPKEVRGGGGLADKLSRAAASRFFLRVEQSGAAFQDRNTLPLFPLLLVMDAEMLEADAKWEAGKQLHAGRDGFAAPHK